MKKLFSAGTLAGVLLGVAPAPAQQAITSAFTYQGRLLNGSLPATGAANVRFDLMDAATAGASVAPTILFDGIANPSVTLAEGHFTVALDFGVAPFNGFRRWLEVGVQYPAGSGSWVST
jgi:hypothetical protein